MKCGPMVLWQHLKKSGLSKIHAVKKKPAKKLRALRIIVNVNYVLDFLFYALWRSIVFVLFATMYVPNIAVAASKSAAKEPMIAAAGFNKR